MADLEGIRDAVKSTLEAHIVNFRVYDTVPDAANVVPCAVVVPMTIDFNVAFGRGTDTYEFEILVLTSMAETDVGQNQLDSYVSGSGVRSIRQTVFNHRTLGLANTNAHISGMTDYGARFTIAELNHIGARLRLIVHTIGTE